MRRIAQEHSLDAASGLKRALAKAGPADMSRSSALTKAATGLCEDPVIGLEKALDAADEAQAVADTAERAALAKFGGPDIDLPTLRKRQAMWLAGPGPRKAWAGPAEAFAQLSPDQQRAFRATTH